MNVTAFQHRYGLAFAGQEETAADLHRQLVETSAWLATAEGENGRAQTAYYRLLSAAEMFLGDRLTREGFGKVVEGERR